MFKLLPQLIVIAAAATIVIIVLRRLPQVTVREEETELPPTSANGGERAGGFWLRSWGYLRELVVRIYRAIAAFVYEAKDHTVKAHYFERVSQVLKIKSSRFLVKKQRVVPGPKSVLEKKEQPAREDDRTEEMLIKIIESDPTNRSAYEGLGKLYLEAKKFKDALEVYTYLARVYPGEDKYISKLGLVNFNLGNYDAAIDAYQKALELQPDAPHRLINLSLCYEAKGQMNDAVSSVKRALEQSPEDVQYLLLLSDFLVREGQNPAAEEVLEKILELEPTNHVAREKLMQLKF
jgi:tetratricopeptide (TPR) repeat protein